jgi:DNA-binding MarR family transcriptional regulator
MSHLHGQSRNNPPGSPETDATIRGLAQFRYVLRKFLRFSENAARQCGVTPQQHQLLLGVAGFTGRGSATVSELAEFLQERPHSVVGLVERAVQHGLVMRTQDEVDRRVVNVSLTANGWEILTRLSALHQDEAQRIQELLGSSRAADSSSAGSRS